MFGRGFLLSTFIVAVIFASTVYSSSSSQSKKCSNGVCTCTLNGKEVKCAAEIVYILTKDECEKMGPVRRAEFKEVEKMGATSKQCPPGPYGSDPPTDGAEKIEFALGLMVASLFSYHLLH